MTTIQKIEASKKIRKVKDSDFENLVNIVRAKTQGLSMRQKELFLMKLILEVKRL